LNKAPERKTLDGQKKQKSLPLTTRNIDTSVSKKPTLNMEAIRVDDSDDELNLVSQVGPDKKLTLNMDALRLNADDDELKMVSIKDPEIVAGPIKSSPTFAVSPPRVYS